jgi:hypothetical protein
VLTSLLLVPLAGLLVIPFVKSIWRPSEALSRWLSSPWRAWLTLLAVNLTIMGVTVGLALKLFRLRAALDLPLILGPTLSYVVWTWFGMALPLRGVRRWAVALGGMAPYLCAMIAVWLWYRHLEASVPGDDLFHVWMGGLMVTVVCAGATLLGSLIVGLQRRTRGPAPG